MLSNWLILLGILTIVVALWKERAKEARTSSEVKHFQKIRDELVTAKQEVQVLMEQLEVASEKIVEEISVGLEEIKNHSESGTKKTGGEGAESADMDDVPQKEEAPQQTAAAEHFNGGSVSKEKKDKSRTDNTIAFPARETKLRNKKAVTQAEALPELPDSPKHQMVYAMAAMGYAEEEIARQMKIGKGEVNLMLQLKRKGEKENV